MKTYFFTIVTIGLLGSAALLRAAEETKPVYPLTTCVVSSEKLGEMGPPATLNYKGIKLQFCCKECVKKFNADPKAYLKKYEQAVKDAKASE